MGPFTILLIVGVAGLVIWRLLRSYWPGADTRGGDVVDGYSPTYASSSDAGYDHEIHHQHSHESASHGASGGWDSPGEIVAESGGGADGGDSGGGDSGDGGDSGGGDGGDGGGGSD